MQDKKVEGLQVKAKICGITRWEDAKLAAQSGAWALGFIFYAKSPRNISYDVARDIISRLDDEGLTPSKTVGVFVNASLHEMQTAREKVGLTTLQLHGDETPEICAELGGDIIKAFRLASKDEVEQLKFFAGKVSYFLIDAAVKGAYGGTGQLSDWDAAKAVKGIGPLILSGGLTSANAADAWEAVKPFALDLASGVEATPGIKDHEKLKTFFASIRNNK